MDRITEIPKLPARPTDAHKGTFGKVLVIAGSRGMTGAAAITGMSALRSGAGLVRVAVPASVLPTVAAMEPCFTTIALPDTTEGCISTNAVDVVMGQLADNDVVAFGPGVGQDKGAREMANMLIGQPIRIVIDADGLNCLARSVDWIEKKKASIILTPHPGEMGRLWTGALREEMPDGQRTQTAVGFAQHSGCVVVLKGAGTVVTDGSKRIYVNTTGNPGMATAGAGDALTGVIAALAGGGMNDFDAAVAGTYIHGLAGDLAAEAVGQDSMIATDIVRNLGGAFVQMRSRVDTW